MKKLILLLLLATTAGANTPISVLPLSGAASINPNDSFPYVDSIADATKRFLIDDIVNLTAVSSRYAPLASPTFTGVVTSPSFVGPLTGTASGNELPLTFSSPLSRSVNAISVPQATGSVAGYLASADWTTFNSKLSTTRNINTTLPLTGGGNLSSDRTIACNTSGSTQSGCLASADWTTFNSKQSALTFGSVSTSTGGVTVGSGTNSTVGPNVTVDVQTASATQPGLLSSANWSTFNAKQAAGNYITNLTGDVTASGPGSVSATIVSNAVTNSKLAQMTAHTFKGNNTGSTANALDLTATQLTAELNPVVGDTGSGGTKGLAPAPSAGDAAAGKFLKADGTYQVPAGSAVSSVAATYILSSSGTPGATNPINFDTKIVDTVNAVTTGAAWKFTAPSTASYHVSVTVGANISVNIFLYLNGTSTYMMFNTTGGLQSSGSVILPMSTGDFIDIRPSNGTATLAGSGVPYIAWVSISQIH